LIKIVGNYGQFILDVQDMLDFPTNTLERITVEQDQLADFYKMVVIAINGFDNYVPQEDEA
jgi:hypothetical protein